jgi:acetyl esterase/lipase
MTNELPAPPLDPECEPAWRAMSELVFEGGGLRVTAESLPLLRSAEWPDRDTLLLGRRYTHRDLTVPGPAGDLTLAVFEPDGRTDPAPAPAIYWIHGGGMVTGTRFMATEGLDAAEAVGAVVVSVEYRLAPEHPAPAPADDCLAGLAWLVDHAADLGVDPDRVVLGGTSAGGGLAAATALRIRDLGGPPVVGLLLCCPMLDDRMTSVSTRQFGDDLLWTRANNAFGWGALLGDRRGTDDVSPYEAPGRATDLSGLPPTLIDVGSADLFRDEDVALASAIWAAGGDAELHVWAGGFHGSEQMARDAAVSVAARTARADWVRRLLARA